MDLEREEAPLLQQDLDSTPVYPIIHMIREDVSHYVDAPLTYEAMLGPDLTYSLIRPLEEKYLPIQQEGCKAVVFAFLLNRVYFIRDSSFSTSALSHTRAALCEILAIRILRDNESLLDLAVVMTTSWLVFNGASDAVRDLAKENEEDGVDERVGNAIEIAILGKAKRFIKSDVCQKVINSIWSGKCIYQADSSHSIISDTYKRTSVHFYDPRKAPLLDHYRLKVPAIRSVIDYINFLLLFVLFIVAIEYSERNSLNAAEIVFMFYALGFSLEKLATMQEHGLRVYINGTWNGFDIVFVSIFILYIFLRIYGIYWDSYWARNAGIECLSIVAVLIFPRLAFATMSTNLMVLALRSMIVEFMFLMTLAAFCFTGFLYALWTFKRNVPGYSVGQIAWWMLDLWFGLDASGFNKATSFHPFFGPLLMVTYACMSNTLLLTVLVSILSHTFSTISGDAAAEAMYRRAVYTIEGVKADALFSYQPPLNLIALALMLPASRILTPRWFHKVNVFMIRLTNFPILILIAIYERQVSGTHSTTFYESISDTAERVFERLPRSIKHLSFFDGFVGPGGTIHAIFEIDQELNEESAVETLDGRQPSLSPSRRRLSSSHSKHRSQTPTRPPLRQTPPNSPPSRYLHLSPRQRLESMTSRTGSDRHGLAVSPSPLAQLYNPTPLADKLPSSDVGGAVASGVSYGPITRRRLSSIGMIHKPAAELNIKRVQGETAAIGASNINSIPFAQSPGHHPEHHPETVQEVEGEEEDAGSVSLTERIRRLEDSQARIEHSLRSILEHLQNSSSGRQTTL